MDILNFLISNDIRKVIISSSRVVAGSGVTHAEYASHAFREVLGIWFIKALKVTVIVALRLGGECL